MNGGIAVDIGGTKILVASAHAPSQPVCVATPRDGGPDAVVHQILGAVERLDVPGPMVVASPGDLDTGAGVVRYAANLPFRSFDLAGALSDRLGYAVRLVGDATAATLAEFGTGAGAGGRDGAYVTVSTGIGMGLVVDGRLVAGLDGQAGELGHVPVRSHDGVLCGCGQRGCLEAYASGRGMADRARDACEQDVESALTAISADMITANEVIAAYREGDQLARRIVETAVSLLGRAIATIVRMLAPPVVVLGGGVLLAGGLLDPVRHSVARMLAPNDDGVLERLRAATFGQLSSLIGAAALCRGDAAATALLRGTGSRVAA